MTVKELIEELEKLPEDAMVFFADGEYNGSVSYLREVYYNKEASLGAMANTVVLY